MGKFLALCFLVLCVPSAMLRDACAVTTSSRASAATTAARTSTSATTASNYVTPYNYNLMQPFMNNNMRTQLNPGASPGAQNSAEVYSQIIPQAGYAPVSAFATNQNPGQNNAKRRVVARYAAGSTGNVAAANPVDARGTTGTSAPQQRVIPRINANVARAASGNAAVPLSAARSGTMPTGAAPPASSQVRNVVARGARRDTTYDARVTGTMHVVQAYEPVSGVTSERCLADYTECMDSYCQRPEMLYDRCYCSPRLAQIDAEFQPAIWDLTEQLVIIKNGGDNMSRAELEEYWQNTFGDFTGENSLANLNSALDIDWASTESRVQGQHAFVTGHEWCVQHTQGCYYMAENLRGIYRSKIARDCNTYETYLSRLKTAAEALIAANTP